jgi:hypothetical protein
VDTLAPATTRDALRTRVEEAKAALLEAASTAVIKNDPLCQHLNALALSVGAHYDIFCAAEEAQRTVAETVSRHADIVTTGIIDTTRTSLATMTRDAGPQLLKAALPTMQQSLRVLKQRTIIGLIVATVGLVMIAGMFSYAAGLNQGHSQGEYTAGIIKSAVLAGPEAGMDWGFLMSDNNPVPSLAECRKAVLTADDGRHYCMMPVWLDPLPGAPKTDE